ncbi:MAG: methyltransferase domain-containing protein [Chakrabartia sp.]
MLCKICGHTTVEKVITSRAKYTKDKTLKCFECTYCGYVNLPENIEKYDHYMSEDGFHIDFAQKRNGNEFRPGREYYMALTGTKIIGPDNLEVSFFGPGYNIDHEWYKNKYPQSTVKLVDLENYQNFENYEHPEKCSPSDLVIASEVIEHFTNPEDNFKNLFSAVKKDGLIICSTNINDGSELAKHDYPFTAGHCSYWSPISLIKIASQFGFFVDFRTPEIAVKRAGKRKKYIFFFKDVSVMLRIGAYFAINIYAESEKE